MATSMGPNFSGGHPAAMGHPGVAGHAMGPGMPQHPVQQGVPGGMPHQFAGNPMAVSAPGGQVNPAMMGGMPPGSNPHAAHAMQQLTTQQQQLLQQQQQQQQHFQNCRSLSASGYHQSKMLTARFTVNPSAVAAMRQHQAMMQRQQAQQMMAQQGAYANMQGGMPMGMQLNAQQMHQLRQQQARMPQVSRLERCPRREVHS
jgi:hypothetical protein